ncbi:MAG: hypothetical protein U9Q06_00355 [Nanoarchaeota archaeon]|nr:hypothetical protein [Nanoarchaeota archaeon]
MKIQRQIKYNVRTILIEEPLNHEWTICVINSQREIEIIQEKFMQVLSDSTKYRRADEFRQIDKNTIENSGGLGYNIFTIKSTLSSLSSEDKLRIYRVPQRQFTTDRRLTPNKDDIWFAENYISTLIGK